MLVLIGMFTLPFVMVLLPIRLAWQIFRLFHPPIGCLVNKPVLITDIVFKIAAVITVLFFLYRMSQHGPGMSRFLAGYVSIIPFVIYVFSELISSEAFHESEKEHNYVHIKSLEKKKLRVANILLAKRRLKPKKMLMNLYHS